MTAFCVRVAESQVLSLVRAQPGVNRAQIVDRLAMAEDETVVIDDLARHNKHIRLCHGKYYITRRYL